MISKQEKLCAKYAELFGKIDETIVAEAQFLSEWYDGITDIAGEEAKYLVELWRGQHKVPRLRLRMHRSRNGRKPVRRD